MCKDSKTFENAVSGLILYHTTELNIISTVFKLLTSYQLIYTNYICKFQNTVVIRLLQYDYFWGSEL